METLSIPELNARLKTLTSDELILDVRTPEEYSEGHVPGSRNIPVNLVANHAQELKKFKSIYVYCRAGARAAVACQMLGSLGVAQTHCVDVGGFPDWADSGFEIAR